MDLKLIYFFIFIGILILEHSCQRPNTSPRMQKAKDVKSYMNLSIDPCDDFYEYACGNYKNIFPSKNLNVYPISILQQMEDKLDAELLNILVQPLKIDESDMHRYVKDFFGSCMDISQIKRIGNEPIKGVIRDLGGKFFIYIKLCVFIIVDKKLVLKFVVNISNLIKKIMS